MCKLNKPVRLILSMHEVNSVNQNFSTVKTTPRFKITNTQFAEESWSLSKAPSPLSLERGRRIGGIILGLLCLKNVYTFLPVFLVRSLLLLFPVYHKTKQQKAKFRYHFISVLVSGFSTISPSLTQLNSKKKINCIKEQVFLSILLKLHNFSQPRSQPHHSNAGKSSCSFVDRRNQLFIFIFFQML